MVVVVAAILRLAPAAAPGAQGPSKTVAAGLTAKFRVSGVAVSVAAAHQGRAVGLSKFNVCQRIIHHGLAALRLVS
jgi:hypothetical protein